MAAVRQVLTPGGRATMLAAAVLLWACAACSPSREPSDPGTETQVPRAAASPDATRAPGVIVLEPEKAHTIAPPMTLRTASKDTCSGGGYVEIPVQDPRGTDKVNGKAALAFHVKSPGKYYLHGRCWWYDGCGNSFGIQVDTLPKATLTDSTEKRWHWVRLRGEPLLLLEGQHTLVISNSEDGARIDQVLLTSDPDFVPQGIE